MTCILFIFLGTTHPPSHVCITPAWPLATDIRMYILRVFTVSILITESVHFDATLKWWPGGAKVWSVVAIEFRRKYNNEKSDEYKTFKNTDTLTRAPAADV